MKRFLYIMLLMNFIILTATGALRFFIPFNPSISRLHIVSGIILAILIIIHLVDRIKPLKRILKPKRIRFPVIGVVLTIILCIGLWLAAWFNTPLISHLMNWSYEQRNHASILRTQDNVANYDKERLLRTTKLTSTGASIDLELLWKQNPKGAAVAIWAETKSGTIIETLYLTGSMKYSESYPWEGKKLRRGDILPVWRHRYTAVCGVDPFGESDLVSQPTLNHQWLLDNKISEAKEDFVIYCEVNLPSDHLPSLIYAANIEPTSTNPYTLLNLIGQSEGSHEDGEFNYDLSDIDNDKLPIDRILVKTIWGNKKQP